MIVPRTAIVTGATSGLGLETARELARAGSHVILAARNAARATAAMADITGTVPGARLSFEALDLASLASVRDFAARIDASADSLDLLVNNAGVMAIPARMETEDGFEMQLGSNFLGHFALTMRLMPLLLRADAPRVVSLGSLAAKTGRIHFDDLQLTRFYNGWTAYAQTKLACVMFALELARRAKAGGMKLISAAAHPGWAVTNLQSAGPSMGLGRKSLSEIGMRLFEPLMAQSAAAGARPIFLAATGTRIMNGDYTGPNGLAELKGAPTLVRPPLAARNEKDAERLWTVAEHLTSTAL
jgi:NAD(P)-dependent dehydrogenase (short-subunit alcohol dehydrogenase family)